MQRPPALDTKLPAPVHERRTQLSAEASLNGKDFHPARLPVAPGLDRIAVVTGVAGFIGSHLAEALIDGGYQVRGIDIRSPSTDFRVRGNLRKCFDQPGFSFIRADLRSADLAPALAGVDVVFHLAGVPGVRTSWGEQFSEYLTGNVLASDRLMRSCCDAGIPRLVIASSSSVYGAAGPVPSSEQARPSPLSPYAVSKLAAEQLCLARAACRDAPTSVIALRYFTVYGSRQREDMLLGRAIRSAVHGTPMFLYGDGSQRRDFTFVEDAVSATVAAGETLSASTVMNIGGGRSVTVAEVLRTVHETTGRPVNAVVTPEQDGDSPATLADTSKARDLLGWQPRVSLAEGIARQYHWMFPSRAAALLPAPSLRP